MDNLSDLIGDKDQMDWLEDHRNKCKMPVIEEINAKEYDRYIQLFWYKINKLIILYCNINIIVI